jgi:hypothetical protein
MKEIKMKNEQLQSNLAPLEVILADTEISVDSPAELDPKAAQSGIKVEGARGYVRLSKTKRKATWIPHHPLEPGKYRLKASELIDGEGNRMPQSLDIPFFVIDTNADIPDSLRIESFSRLRVGKFGFQRIPLHNKPDGDYIEVMKTVNRDKGKPKEIAFSHDGKQIDFNKLLASIYKNRYEKFGKIHETLYEHLESQGNTGMSAVAVWLNVEIPDQESIKYGTRERGEVPEEISRFRERQHNLLEEFSKKLQSELDLKEVRLDRAAPVLYADMNKEQVRRVSNLDEVGAVFLYEPEGIEDLEDSIAIANSDSVHAQGYDGSGIRVAVWENGPDDTTDLDIEAFYDPSQSNTSEHARHTHAIVKNVEPGEPHGHAPNCDLYSANDKDLDALVWAVQDQDCSVASQSFHRSSEPGSSSPSFDDIYKDWLVLNWPYPMILQAAGNYWDTDPDDIDPPSDEYVNHKGYNSIAVGNHNDDADSMSGSSVFRNPSSDHGDRELPEICANGTGVTTVDLTKSGTSMASPAAAGVTALLQDANSTLSWWPEGCRAILLAGATINVEDDTWWHDVIAGEDASDGSGAVNAYESLRITQSRRHRNSSPSMRGWDIGTLREDDFEDNGLSTFSYKVQVPNPYHVGLVHEPYKYLLGPRHVKVALTWNSKVSTLKMPFIDFEFPLSSHLHLDFDLKIYDSNGVMVGYAGSWDNSYEIAEFNGTPGETYTIRIRKWSGNGKSWYGIAWTVSGGLRLHYEPFQAIAQAALAW